MRSEFLRERAPFEALEAAWDRLVAEADGGLFLAHAWLSTWWRAFHQDGQEAGLDELRVLCAWDEGDRLAGAWPLYLTTVRTRGLRLAVLRVLGDLGGAHGSMLTRPGDDAAAGAAFAGALRAERGWDLLEVPVSSRRAAALAPLFEDAGLRVERTEVPARSTLNLPPLADLAEFLRARAPHADPRVAYAPATDAADGLAELFRILRKEWTAREAAHLAPDPHAWRFLSEIVPGLEAAGLATVGRLVRPTGETVAADLVVRDRARAVQLLCAVDPDLGAPRGGEHEAIDSALERLCLGSLGWAVKWEARRFELAEDRAALGATEGRVERLRVWNRTAVARLHRRVSSLKGAVPRDPLDTLEKLRDAAPGVVQRAVARVASYATFHLYRGELFVRDVEPGSGLALRLLPRDAFEALEERRRGELVRRLDLQLGHCRQKWQRGDMAVLAELDGKPAGIAWCARAAVYVPDIARDVRPAAGECYLHDVYVNPDQRGRQVAPAMLDFLARELRARDVYRGWALIERSNHASTRAFEKAAYVPVADVVFARMGLASRVLVRPPDPEARALLGLS